MKSISESCPAYLGLTSVLKKEHKALKLVMNKRKKKFSVVKIIFNCYYFYTEMVAFVPAQQFVPNGGGGGGL